MTSAEIGEFLGVSENTIKSRIRRARQRLKKYEFMIREILDITTEGETIMAKEARDESKVEARLTEIQRQIADLQNQIKVIEYESDAYLNSRKKDAVFDITAAPV